MPQAAASACQRPNQSARKHEPGRGGAPNAYDAQGIRVDPRLEARLAAAGAPNLQGTSPLLGAQGRVGPCFRAKMRAVKFPMRSYCRPASGGGRVTDLPCAGAQNLPSGARFFRCAAGSSTINTRDFHEPGSSRRCCSGPRVHLPVPAVFAVIVFRWAAQAAGTTAALGALLVLSCAFYGGRDVDDLYILIASVFVNWLCARCHAGAARRRPDAAQAAALRRPGPSTSAR